MSASISKTQRWLDLISHLVGRQYPLTVEEIMQAVPAYVPDWQSGDETRRGSVRRKFERDKDELRAFGVPLETLEARSPSSGETVEGYRIARGDFYLPYLRILSRARDLPAAHRGADARAVRTLYLRPDEVRLAEEALDLAARSPDFPYAEAARSARQKLAFDLGDTPSAPIFFAERARAGEVAARVRRLADALRARKRVGFRYHGIRRGAPTRREVAPYGVFFRSGEWYLVGHDALRDDLRVFNVARMEEPRANPARPQSPDYRIPEGFRVADFVRRHPWELGGEGEEALEARVLFRFPRSLWAEANELGERVEERSGGSAVRRFRVTQPEPFLRWVLGMMGEAEIVEPAELAAGAREMAARVTALHRPAAEG
jgi:proteasome accessory factor B